MESGRSDGCAASARAIPASPSVSRQPGSMCRISPNHFEMESNGGDLSRVNESPIRQKCKKFGRDRRRGSGLMRFAGDPHADDADVDRIEGNEIGPIARREMSEPFVQPEERGR